jgi:hypothetical protein
MKSQSIRVALLWAFGLASPLLTFAGSQPAEVQRWLGKEEMRDRTSITQTVQRGKDTGLIRSEVVIRANAYRSQTPEESRALVQQSGVAHSNWNDSGFHK